MNHYMKDNDLSWRISTLKLGSMQPPKKYKFLQEQVFEGIWPFNKVKSPINVIILMSVYIIWGTVLYSYYQIPPYFLIAGILSAFGLFIWTIGIFSYARKLREIEVERINVVNKKFLIGFLENLFHPSSIVISVLMFTVVTTYYFSVTSFGIENLITNIQKEMNNELLPPILLSFILLLTFDLCYRLGLSLYVILTQIRRNLRLTQYLRSPILKTHFSANDIRNLERADYNHYLAISGGLFLLPLLLFDHVLLVALSTYLLVTSLLTAINLLHLRFLYVRAIPKGMLSLLRSARFAKVGTCSFERLPHVTPSLFTFDGRNIFIATSIKSKKVKNLSQVKEISIFIDSNTNRDFSKSIGVLITGRARVYGHNITSGILYYLILGFRILRIYFLFRRKYPDYISEYWKENRNLPRAWRIFPIISRTIVEIVPENFYFWKASRPTLVKF